MNSKNSKTCYAHRIILNLTNKIKLKVNNKLICSTKS